MDATYGFPNRPKREATIITVDQLPDSRRAILLALKREGPSTIARLAAELQLTGEAVRQQLLQLQREGWIEAKIARVTLSGTFKLGLNWAFTWVLTSHLGGPAWWPLVPAVLVTPAVTFGLNRWWVFA